MIFCQIKIIFGLIQRSNIFSVSTSAVLKTASHRDILISEHYLLGILSLGTILGTLSLRIESL